MYDDFVYQNGQSNQENFQSIYGIYFHFREVTHKLYGFPLTKSAIPHIAFGFPRIEPATPRIEPGDSHMPLEVLFQPLSGHLYRIHKYLHICLRVRDEM